jgi:DNA-binding NarL/FixJ family response regulator
MVRLGLREFFRDKTGVSVVGEATTGSDAVRLAGELSPDVVLLDLRMPGGDGLFALENILKQNPAVRILVLTSSGDRKAVSEAIRLGAAGYVLKEIDPEELYAAVMAAASGRFVLDPSLTAVLLKPDNDTPDGTEPLTPREREILGFVADGWNNREISDRLHISEGTVKSHVSHILAKLGFEHRTQAALYAVKSGLAD